MIQKVEKQNGQKPFRKMSNYSPLEVDVGLNKPLDATVLRAAAAASEGIEAAMARSPEIKVENHLEHEKGSAIM